MRYFLKLSYNGTSFHGWQSQPNAVSVQQRIEEALSIVTRFQISITGAGRTDTGVHARTMYAHFDMPYEIENNKRFLVSVNRLVGKDIAISEIRHVPDAAHARFDATERTYKYFVSYEKSPFLYPFSWYSPSKLDVEKMNDACRILLGTKDFTSFAKLHSDAKTNICDVRKAVWEIIPSEDLGINKNILSGDGLVFTISADRFLRNMVRAIVGTTVDVGRGKISIERFRDIISAKDRCAAGTSMPACALFLWDIKYPYIH